MTARLLPTLLATALLFPASAAAQLHGTRGSHRPGVAGAARRHTSRPAGAARRPQHTPIVLAVSLAEQYWGAVPCEGRVSVTADASLPSDLAAATDAWVTFDSPLGANDLAAPARSYTNCVVALARWQWPTVASMTGDWGMFCLTVVHEIGHLLGHPHSSARGSVMAPVFTDESDVPRICRTDLP